MSSETVSDTEVEAWLTGIVNQHYNTIMKTPITATLAFFTVFVMSDSYVKAAVVALICVPMTLFSTWRRRLEPVCFWAFVLAVFNWCDLAVVNQIRTAVVRYVNIG